MIKQRVEDALWPRCGTSKPPRAIECPNRGLTHVRYETTRINSTATGGAPLAFDGAHG